MLTKYKDNSANRYKNSYITYKKSLFMHLATWQCCISFKTILSILKKEKMVFLFQDV